MEHVPSRAGADHRSDRAFTCPHRQRVGQGLTEILPVSCSVPDRRGESQPPAAWIAPGPARRASYEPQLLRERLKPIIDELKDTLESFEGEPTPEDHRWLRGQLRRLVDRLNMP